MHYLIMGGMHLRAPSGSGSALSAPQLPLCIHSVSECKGRLLLPGDDLTSRFWSCRPSPAGQSEPIRRSGEPVGSTVSSHRLMFPALSGTNLLLTCPSPTGSQITCYDGNRWLWVDSLSPGPPMEAALMLYIL